MADATQELIGSMTQERANARTMVQSVAPDAKINAVCSVTGEGHYWYVSPPPIQKHRCKHCYATKEYRIPT